MTACIFPVILSVLAAWCMNFMALILVTIENLLSDNNDFSMCVPRPEFRRRRKIAQPDHFSSADHHRAKSSFGSGQMPFLQELFNLLRRLAVARPKAITGPPVPNPQFPGQ